MMKRILGALAVAGLASAASAAPVFHPSGPMLTYGAVSQNQTLMSTTENPAAAASVLGEEDGAFGFGLISAGVGLEVGQVDNFQQDLDALSTELNAFDPAVDGLDKFNTIKARFDDFLVRAGEDGYLRTDLAIQPVTPLVMTSRDWFGGSIVLDANISAEAKLSVLDSPLEFNPSTLTPETDTSLYVKAAAIREFSLGYSRPVLETDNGVMYGGFRAKGVSMQLAKALVNLMDSDGIDQTLQDTADAVEDPQTKFGLDMGFVYVTDHYRFGATFRNLIKPEFEYTPIGQNCAPDNSACHSAASFADRIDLEETHVMDSQITLEGAVYSKSKNWMLAAAMDTSPVHSPVADEYQWLTVSTGYATPSWWIPGFRLGYRQNLAGTEMSYATLGLTLFKFLSVDVAYGLQAIEIDGASAPRAFAANISTELYF